VPKALDCVQPCCRFPQVQPAARCIATKSPSSSERVTLKVSVTIAVAGYRLFKAAAGLYAVQGRCASLTLGHSRLSPFSMASHVFLNLTHRRMNVEMQA